MFKGDRIRGLCWIPPCLERCSSGLRHDRPDRDRPYELPIELIIGVIGSAMFVGMLIYRLNHGRKHFPPLREKEPQQYLSPQDEEDA